MDEKTFFLMTGVISDSSVVYPDDYVAALIEADNVLHAEDIASEYFPEAFNFNFTSIILGNPVPLRFEILGQYSVVIAHPETEDGN